MLFLFSSSISNLLLLQVKYREDGRADMSSSLYSTMAETPESSFAREVMDMQSQVRPGEVPEEVPEEQQ